MHGLRNFFLGFFALALFGCASSGKSLLAPHDEMLTAPYAMDYTYLQTMEAVQAHPDWELTQTIKEDGIIQLRNQRYSSYADADLRTLKLLLKRTGPHETTIQIAKESQSVVGGDEILKLIKERLALQ